MRNVIVTVVGAFFVFLIMSDVLADRAQAGKVVLGCSLTIAKSAGDTDTLFSFLVDPSEGDDFEIQVASGGENGFGLASGESALVSEIVPEGWRLTNVVCESAGGFSLITDEENNVFVDCVTTGAGVCTFTNVAAGAIPTLSEWGMISVAIGFVLIGVFFAIKRLRASKQSDAIG
jgi:hypothetical protein